MRVGMTLPSMVPGVDRATFRAWCEGIDAGPFSTLAVGERITYHNLEMMTSLAAAAVLTERVRLETTVCILPMHPAMLIAKQAATIDVLSGGRMVLGVGIGGRDADFQAAEASPARRHQRLDDQVALLRRVWAGESPADGLEPIGPPPVQPGGPPLFAGALGPKAIARAARWATGISGFVTDPAPPAVGAGFDQVRAAWSGAGRTGEPVLTTSFWYSLDTEGEERTRAYARQYLGIFGAEFADAMADSVSVVSEAALAEALSGLEAIGCDEVMLVPTTAAISELDRTAAIVEAVSPRG